MISAIDSNVLIDILTDDSRFAANSIKVMRDAQSSGKLVVCEIVLAEIARYFKSAADMRRVLDKLNIGSENLGDEACHLAGKSFVNYRARSGKRDRILADFLIASHAQTRCSQLITRDRGFYRDYFPQLMIVEPQGNV